ncbi:MAG: NAD-dependent epimerase/dehydratase family protein [Planctomycetota bacterium]|jgi:CDP-paratose 2-epimerase
MSQVTITGGAGFIGANVARHWLARGARVVVYDTLERKGCLENVRWLQSAAEADRLEIRVGDVRMPTRGLAEAVETSDALFHFAGQVAVTTSVVDPVLDFEANALGTFKLLELVRTSQGKRPVFLYSSTNKVYGGMEDVRIEEGEDRYRYADYEAGIPENRLLDFHSPYGCSKGCADQYVRDYARIYGLSTVVFRQSCIYGYRQFGLEDQGWVAWFVIAAVLGRPITIFGNGKQVRDVLFIDDLVRAYDMAIDRIETTAGRVYNIGGGPDSTISLRDLVGMLRDEVRSDLAITHDDWRPGDQPVYVSDIGRARADFGWAPEIDWRTGVHRLLDWVREHRDMLERLF